MNKVKSLRLLLIIVAGSAIALYSMSLINPEWNPMKRLFVINPYDSLWKKVDSLEALGLTESSKKVVDEIFTLASGEKNHPQRIKSLLHLLKYNETLQEDAFRINFENVNKEIKQAESPYLQILHSIRSQMLWTFYQQNRWRFYERTQTTSFDQDDVLTWDLNKIISETFNSYKQSITQENLLQNIPIDRYDAILTGDDSLRQRRPTLYDFLAHRALSFYKNNESGLTKPAYEFELNDSRFFDKGDAFVLLPIETRDTLSHFYHALITYQKLLSFHLKKHNTDAIVYIESDRLSFLHSNAVNTEKDSLYLRRLEGLVHTYSGSDVCAEVLYQLALYYHGRAEKYNPFQETTSQHKTDYITAFNYCQQADEKYNKTLGANNARYLATQIKMPSVSIQTENGNPSSEFIPALIKYRNLKQLHFRLYKVDYDNYYNWIYQNERNRYDSIYFFITQQPLIQQWDQKLTGAEDYHHHTTEISIQPQSYGFYILMASDGAEFSFQNNALTYSTFWVSDLMHISRQENNYSENTLLIMNRKTGTPVAKADVNIFQEEYNYSQRRYFRKKVRTFKTGKNGDVRIPYIGKDSYSYFHIEFRKGNDRYVSNSQLYQYKDWYGYYQDKGISVHYFLDRGIYRPGQTVHFKGIVINTQNDISKIVTHYKTKVSIVDPNYEEVDKINVESNEYGTFSGSFVIPQGRLTGQWHLGNNGGTAYFSVEEYKRPKFDVKFDTVKTEYKLGDKISIEGYANALAGYPIDGANVSYRVYRNVRFPDWIYWWRPGFYWKSSQMEITHGTSATDEKGKFRFEFEAIPDKRVNTEWEPFFDYTVEVNVTDINGETRSGFKYIRAGYSSLYISSTLPERISRHDTNAYKLEVLNHEYFPQHNEGQFSITRLSPTSRLIKQKGWTRVDQPVMDEKTFQSRFPNLSYADEENPVNWKREITILQSGFSIKNNILRPSKIANLEPGIYLLEAVVSDKYGKSSNFKKLITVYDEKKSSTFSTGYFQVVPLKNYCEPGDNASYLISSNAKDIRILMEVEHKNNMIHTEIISLNQSQKVITIPVKEEHRGNFSIHFTTIKDNRLYTQSESVHVPYTNKMLKLKFATFRNEMLPGSQEEWKITVADYQGGKAAAEMLVSMYDASLDAFVPNNWWFSAEKWHYTNKQWNSNDHLHMAYSSLLTHRWHNRFRMRAPMYEYLHTFGFRMMSDYYGYRGSEFDDIVLMDGEFMAVTGNVSETTIAQSSGKKGEARAEEQESSDKSGGLLEKSKDEDYRTTDTRKLNGQDQQVQIRSNFNETAFFYPHLQTNEEGEVVFSFKMPESITEWNFNAFAHTKDLKSGTLSEKVVTKKKLMVNSFAPRFFREGDKIIFSTKVTNISGSDLQVKTTLVLTDALTGKDLNSVCGVSSVALTKSIKKDKSEPFMWEIKIPEGVYAITYRIVAQGGEHSDGEEMTIPVLSNRMLVTESQPLHIKGKGEKKFTFEKLTRSGSSSTLAHHRVTLEFTSHPVWYAIQALPYMMEFPYECSEQTFNRLYANTLAHHIVESHPRIKNVFEIWSKQQPNALLSNLEKNQELKEVILQETPWVMDAKNESERKQRIALLFDFNRMANEKQRTVQKLIRMQSPNGGWPWFEGGPDNRFITQYIVTGFGKLHKTGITDNHHSLTSALQKAIVYLDERILEDYQYLLRYKVDLTKKQIGYHQIQYLYARSFFNHVELNARHKEAWKYYMQQAQTYWNTESMFMKAMIAISLHRNTDKSTPKLILQSLKENAIRHDELGMYWKQNQAMYWYEAPIEMQALMIEAFAEIEGDVSIVDDLKLWLLKNKQTNDWKTTKATADACYALLINGSNWLTETELAVIELGDITVNPNQKTDIQQESGTGYIKTSWSGKDIKPGMGHITVKKNTEGPAWGAVYWQYFENLDKITSASTQIKISKKLFKQEHSDRGPVIKPVTDKTVLLPGDKIKVRIELSTDRHLEYVHMKDMRASAFEPENVFSGYKWQDGFGYYEATKDAATHIFIEYLPRGTYVFEYPVRVTHEGIFSNGITTLQCMYAPEFSSHSEGILVKTGK